METKDQLAAELRITAEIHEELFLDSIGRGKYAKTAPNPDMWESARARGILEAAGMLANLTDHYPVEVIRDEDHMRDFEFGTPFLIISPSGRKVSVMKDLAGIWWASMYQPITSDNDDRLAYIWSQVRDSESIVIALPVPKTLPVEVESE